MKARILFGALALAGATAAPAATFTASSGFGGLGIDFACNVSTNTTGFATGRALDYSDQGCIGGFTVDVDTDAHTITLTNIPGTPYGDYEYSQLEITGITETIITSLKTLQSNPLFTPLGYAPEVPVPGLSFTGSSILITFAAPESEFNFGNDGGQAIFAYNVGGVPEAATWAMLIAGFGLTGVAMRRRGATAVAA